MAYNFWSTPKVVYSALAANIPEENPKSIDAKYDITVKSMIAVRLQGSQRNAKRSGNLDNMREMRVTMK